MNRTILPLLSTLFLALGGCLGGDDPEGDGQADITHAIGRWQLDYHCQQSSGAGSDPIDGCTVGDIYDAGLTDDGRVRLGVAWESAQGTGVLRANALSITFEYGPQNTPEYWTEEAIYTFDRANPDIFKKSSSYGGNGVNGTCVGSAVRIPDTQVACQPRS